MKPRARQAPKGRQRDEWVMPPWMERYRPLINNTGGNTVEELVNDHDTIVQVNAPRALLCVAVTCQVSLLETLYKRGELAHWPSRGD